MKLIVILPNNKIKKPADPTKEGYKFDGWYADSDFIKPFDFDNTLVTQNLTLYSKWTKIEEEEEHHSSGGGSGYIVPKTGIK